jgi:hypothetical protein
MLASAATDVERLQPALEGADNAGCDAGRVPIHPTTAPKDWNQNGLRQPFKDPSAVMVHDRLSDDGT